MQLRNFSDRLDVYEADNLMNIGTIADIALGAFFVAVFVVLFRNRQMPILGIARAGPMLIPERFYFHMGDYIQVT
jgi:hypothetical protein